jgi:hypothetical protein
VGVETNLYLGPYAEWLVPLARKREDLCRAPDRCPNPSSGYCPECGLAAPARFREHDAPALVSVPEVDVLTGEALLAVGDMGCPWVDDGEGRAAFRVVPNVRRPGAPDRGGFFHGRWPPAEPVTSGQIEHEVSWLVAAFAPELLALARAFRKPPALRWGVLCWHS